ncbi:MAG: UDP-N-acetylglucosamine 2-epimerase (non-hydrolyzing) [Nitrospirota bacterium]
MKLLNIVGARPNFMKIAPIIHALNNYNRSAKRPIDHLLVHTGQHYDEKMSKLFFDDLNIPKPDIDLEVGSGSHAEQTAEIIKRFEKICLNECPTHILVVGDVNSTIACALVASKLGIKVIHVEAGLRSFDRTMPEEINRILTDAISDILFITEDSAEKNLLREGVPNEKIFFVGNVMIDTLLRHRESAKSSLILNQLGLKNGSYASDYGVLTLHRPSNVDEKGNFENILYALLEVSRKLPIIFPVHPRTRKKIEEFGFTKYLIQEPKVKGDKTGICSIEPLGYLDFLSLMSEARVVLTDSGGIQEETTILGVPCITLRSNTERPVTVTDGTNIVAGIEKENIIKKSLSVLNSNKRDIPKTPPFWDGRAAERIVGILSSFE